MIRKFTNWNVELTQKPCLFQVPRNKFPRLHNLSQRDIRGEFLRTDQVGTRSFHRNPDRPGIQVVAVGIALPGTSALRYNQLAQCNYLVAYS